MISPMLKNIFISIFIFLLIIILNINNSKAGDLAFKTELFSISEIEIEKNIIGEQTKFLNYISYDYFQYFKPNIILGISNCVIDDKSFARLAYDYHLTYGLGISGKSILNSNNFNIGYDIKYLLTDFKDIPNLYKTNLKQKTLLLDLIGSYIFADFFEPYISIGYLKDSFKGDFNLSNDNKITLKLGSIFNLTDYIRFNFSALFLGQKGIYAGLEYDFVSDKSYKETKTKIVKQCPVCKSYYHFEDNYCAFDGTELKPKFVSINKKIIFIDSK